MSRLLVHLHVFYPEQLPYFLEKLSHIQGCAWDLYVTYSREEALIRREITAACPQAVFLPVENVGFDVWPFLRVLRAVDFDRYDYVLKLHTKHGAPGYGGHLWSVQFSGYRWRNLLVDAVLRSPAQFRKALRSLEEDPGAGLVCDGLLLQPRRSELPEDNALLEEELARMGLQVGPDDMYCAGTMFLARLAPYAVLRDAPVTAASYSAQSQSSQTGTLAHVQERICTYAVTAAGYRIVPATAWPLNYALLQGWRKIKPFFQFVFKIDRDGPNGEKCLTLLGLRFVLKKKK